MEIDLNNVQVSNNAEASRFEAQIGPYTSVIDYYYSGQAIVFTHTGVPEEISGNGIAGKMAQTALEYARAERLEVVPLCPYVAAYIKRHPEYKDLVSERYRG